MADGGSRSGPAEPFRSPWASWGGRKGRERRTSAPDPRHQLRERERLGQVIVSPAHGECGKKPDGSPGHIARLPGGAVALAIQYGHLRTLTSEGYSNSRELRQTGEIAQVA